MSVKPEDPEAKILADLLLADDWEIQLAALLAEVLEDKE